MRAWLVLLAALAGGCAATVSPEAPPVSGSLGAALAGIERTERETRTLTALFRMTVHRPGTEPESLRGALVVVSPDRLRLQLFSLGVMTVYDYTVNGDRFRIRWPMEGRTQTGRFAELSGPERAALAYDLRPLFLPRGPLSEAELLEESEAAWRVRRADGRELEVSRADGLPAAETVSDPDGVKLRAGYGDYREVDGARLPFRIAVEAPATAVTLDIEVSRYRRNEPIDEDLFDFRDAR